MAFDGGTCFEAHRVSLQSPNRRCAQNTSTKNIYSTIYEKCLKSNSASFIRDCNSSVALQDSVSLTFPGFVKDVVWCRAAGLVLAGQPGRMYDSFEVGSGCMSPSQNRSTP